MNKTLTAYVLKTIIADLSKILEEFEKPATKQYGTHSKKKIDIGGN